MSSSLRYLGLLVLAILAAVLVAEAMGFISPGSTDLWIRPAMLAGVGLFGLGLLLALLAPVGRWMRQGRCVRCGVSTERGQTYCNDHLKETVSEYREQSDLHRLGG